MTAIKLVTKSLHEVFNTPLAIHGEQCVIYADRPWTLGPAGSLDLFKAFSDRYGCIALTEGMAFFGDGKPTPLYFVPAGKVDAFNHFLDTTLVDLPDGRMVAPICRRPGSIGPAECPDRRMRSILNRCHVIQPLIYAADHPAVKHKREALAGFNWN
jgi:hypothetical protein